MHDTLCFLRTTYGRGLLNLVDLARTFLTIVQLGPRVRVNTSVQKDETTSGQFAASDRTVIRHMVLHYWTPCVNCAVGVPVFF